MSLISVLSLVSRRTFSNNTSSVYISRCKNVYTNLAFEDWLYKNMNFTNERLLLLWKNDPCVIIGTFQNPWLETNPSTLSDMGVSLARRSSGGGAVYNDGGNLNLSFFTSRKDYGKKVNLEFIRDVILKKFNVAVEISGKSNIMINGFKISGSASKLGLKNAYHHCSILVDINKENLNGSLEKSNMNIKTNATKSVRWKITNLKDVNPSITIEDLTNCFKDEYLTDDGQFKIVDPTEDSFLGLTNAQQGFCSWEWLYGRTPKFAVSTFLKNIGNVIIDVDKGKIANVKIENDILVPRECQYIFKPYIGLKFDDDTCFLLHELCNREYCDSSKVPQYFKS